MNTRSCLGVAVFVEHKRLPDLLKDLSDHAGSTSKKMDSERSYAYRLDPEDPCFLSQTGRSDRETVVFSTSAGQLDELITKTSELEASTVNNARTKFLYLSV